MACFSSTVAGKDSGYASSIKPENLAVNVLVRTAQASDNEDFAVFRKKQLKLPSRERAVNLVVVGDALLAGLINNNCERNSPISALLPGNLLLSERNRFQHNADENILNKSGMSVLLLPPDSAEKYAGSSTDKKPLKQNNITETVIYKSYKNDGTEANKKYVVFPQRSLQECRQVKSLTFDLDRDGVEENYSLRDGRVTVTIGKGVIWQTTEAWWVDDFFLNDANNDGTSDLSLLVWKSGSFGTQKPFWIKSEDRSIKNHLFVFKLKNGTFKPVWQSSNLDRPVLAADITDLDGDGKQELVAVEGSYTDPTVRQVTVWRWKGWGFYLVSG